jgi:methionyl-tRNA synthetase
MGRPRAIDYVVTTPLFYVNAKPHLGHIYSVTLGDCMARFIKLTGRSSILTSGTGSVMGRLDVKTFDSAIR